MSCHLGTPVDLILDVLARRALFLVSFCRLVDTTTADGARSNVGRVGEARASQATGHRRGCLRTGVYDMWYFAKYWYMKCVCTSK